MNSMRAVVVIVFLLVLGFSGCDTSRNTVDPQEKYFLRYYGLAGYQEAVDMVQIDTDNFLLLGNSRLTPDAPSQVYLVKVNANGNVLNATLLPATNSQIAKDIEPTTTGEYLILIDSITNTGKSDILVKRVDDLGNITADSTFSFKGDYNEVGSTITQLFTNGSPDGFIVAGYSDAAYDSVTSTALSGKTALKIRFNQDFTLFREPWYNFSSAEGDDVCLRIVQRGDLYSTTNPPFILFGYTNSSQTNSSYNYWISPIDFKGEGVSNANLESSPPDQEKLTGVASINSLNTNFALSGTITNNSGDDRIFIAGVLVGQAGHTLNELNVKELGIDLGNLQTIGASYQNVSITPLNRNGYLVAANQILVDDTDIILTKLTVDGTPAWPETARFGGDGNDRQSTILELPDGRILLLGTMEIGNDRQSKMVLMKLNSNGQLRE